MISVPRAVGISPEALEAPYRVSGRFRTGIGLDVDRDGRPSTPEGRASEAEPTFGTVFCEHPTQTNGTHPQGGTEFATLSVGDPE